MKGSVFLQSWVLFGGVSALGLAQARAPMRLQACACKHAHARVHPHVWRCVFVTALGLAQTRPGRVGPE